jgi:hypothetical protein
MVEEDMEEDMEEDILPINQLPNPLIMEAWMT